MYYRNTGSWKNVSLTCRGIENGIGHEEWRWAAETPSQASLTLEGRRDVHGGGSGSHRRAGAWEQVGDFFKLGDVKGCLYISR